MHPISVRVHFLILLPKLRIKFIFHQNKEEQHGKAISMIPYVAHCADRRRRSGAQTSATEVERSRTGRRSVRAQWRTPPEGEVWV